MINRCVLMHRNGSCFAITKSCKKYRLFNAKLLSMLPQKTPQEGPQSGFWSPEIACRASGAALGSQVPSLDVSGRISALGSFLGCFLEASGAATVFISRFLACHGVIFSNVQPQLLFYIRMHKYFYVSIYILHFHFIEGRAWRDMVGWTSRR